MEKIKVFGGVFLILILFGLINFNSLGHCFIMEHSMSNMQMEKSLISTSSNLKSELIDEGKYKCCLKNPCSYCLLENETKTETFNGKILECECLVEIMNGESPCGECIGEILEGNGNKYISKYFATAIAEKTGNKETIQQIIFEKYGTPIEEQI